MKNTVVALAVCFFALSVVAEGRTAFAQESSGQAKAAKKKKKKKKEDKVSEADKLLVKDFQDKAMGLFAKGDYEGALTYFLKADAITSTSYTLFSIAKCYDNMYKYKEAYDYYNRYIDTGEKANYDAVIEAIARIESMPVIVKVVTTPAGATVYIDGKEVTFQKTPIVSEVEAGLHTILIKKPGFKDVSRELEIPFGGVGKIDETLHPITSPAVFDDKAPGSVKPGTTGKPAEKPKEAAKPKEEPKPKAIADVKLAGTGDVYGEEPKPEGKPPGNEKKKKKETLKLEKKARQPMRPVPMALSLAAGATVSTSKMMGSYIDVSLGVFFRIRDGFVGLGIDNMFFVDGYLLAGYPAGGYTLRVWKDLSLSFAAGFGAAYLHAFRKGYDPDGAIVIETGSHWDLVAHADVKLRYRIGPIILQAIPVHADVLLGVGSIEPAPLAQFAFLAGLAVEF